MRPLQAAEILSRGSLSAYVTDDEDELIHAEEEAAILGEDPPRRLDPFAPTLIDYRIYDERAPEYVVAGRAEEDAYFQTMADLTQAPTWERWGTQNIRLGRRNYGAMTAIGDVRYDPRTRSRRPFRRREGYRYRPY